MNQYIVNSDSSLISLNTQTLQGGSSIIVYVSTTTETDQFITIRDVDGFISSPQSIIISTVGCSITDEAQPIVLQQRFSYLSLQSISSNIWTIVNKSAFFNPSLDYTTKDLNTLNLNVLSNANVQNYVSTISLINSRTLNINNSLVCYETLITSTLNVNSSNLSPYVANTSGIVLNTGSYYINGEVSTVGNVSLFSSLTVRTGISTTGSFNINGGITQSTINGLFKVQGSISTGYELFVLNELSTGRQFQLSTSATLNRNLTVSTFFTHSTISRIANTNILYLSSAYHLSRSDISVVDPTYTGSVNPVLEIQGGLSATSTIMNSLTANTYGTRSIFVSGSISSTTLSSIIFTNTSILNTNGSFSVSSIACGSGNITNLYGPGGIEQLPRVATQTTTAINTIVQYISLTNSLTVESTNVSTLHSGFINTSTLNLGNTELKSDSLTLSTLFISTAVNGTNLSSIQMSQGSIVNTSGSIQTRSTFCSTVTLTNPLLGVYEINSGNTPIRFSSPMTRISTAIVSSAQVGSAVTSSLKGVSIQFGSPLPYSTGTLYLIPSTVSGLSTNTPYEYVSGLGTFYSPLVCKASNDRSVYMSLGNISSFSTSYINATMNYRNDGNINGVAGFRIRNTDTYSTLISFNANPIAPLQTVTLSNYPIVRDFSPIGTTYFISGVNTSPLTSESPNIMIGVGEGTSGTSIQYSTDSGTTWMNPPNSIFTTKGNASAWNGEKWVVAGQGGNVLGYSYTGLVWYGTGSSVFTTEGRTVVWNGAIWIAGGSGTNTLAYSYDGLVWTGLGSVIFSVQVNSIAWNGYMFIAAGQGTNTLAYSSDGLVWTGLLFDVFTTAGNGVAWGQNKWVAVGEGSATIAYSSTGLTWTTSSVVLLGGGKCIGWNGVKWVAGGTGTYPLVYSSSGTLWSLAVSSPMPSIYGVAWAGESWTITGSSGGFAISTDGVTWTSGATTEFTGNGYGITARSQFEGVALQSSLLYATGDNFTVAYSLGGSTWTTVQSLIMGVAGSIIWNGSMWLAGMITGSDTILYSYDGVNWIGLGQIAFNTRCNQIAWNGFLWVATGFGVNTLFYSYDGLSWTGLGSTIFTTEAFGIAWGSGLFVATGSGSACLASSPDGINWTASGSTVFTEGRKIAYGNGLFIACGVAGTSSMAYSSTGLTWTPVASPPFSVSAYDVAWNGSIWLAIGTNSNTVNVAYSSTGLTWTGITVADISVKGLAWSAPFWYLSGTTTIIYKSTDGINWSSGSSTSGPAYAIASKSLYPYGTVSKTATIACGTGATKMAGSSDGRYWFSITSPFTTSALCVAWNGTIWVAGGSGTYQVAYSTNGIDWTGVTLSNVTAIYGVAWSTGKWVAVGSGSFNRAESTDGITWTSIVNSSGGFFAGDSYAIIGGVGGWIATGLPGILSSVDGTTWTDVNSTLFTAVYSVGTNGKQFVAGGTGTNTIAVSFNGSTFIGLGATIFSTKCAGVIYGSTSWVAVGEGTNTLAVSTDGGLTWTGLGSTIFSTRGTSVYWNGQNFVATGEGTNTLAVSADGFVWSGLGTSVFSSGKGVGGKATFPIQRYSVREARIYNLRSVGGGAATSQTVVQKFSSSSAWDSAVYTAESYTNTAYLAFTPTSKSTWTMVGLSETPSAGTAPAQLNYAISCNSGIITVYQVGFVVQTFSSFNLGDTFKIIYNGTRVQYYWNTTLLRSTSRAVGAPLHMSCIMFSPNSVIKDLDFHEIYSLNPVQSTLSTASFIATTTPGVNVPFSPPLYLTLNDDIVPSVWTLSLTAGGTLSNASTSFYADVYINTTKYFSTNVVSNVNLTNVSTYSLAFNVPTAISYNSGDTFNFHIRGTKTDGDAYVYANWVNSNSSQRYSTVVRNSQVNPNAVEFLEFFHTSYNTGLQTSELSVYLSDTSTPTTTSYVNSNYGLIMNRSFIKWNNAHNGITIQNRFNDIQTRSLLYTGALYNASDSNLKNSIEYIDSSLYMTAISNLPLRRYNFSDAYRSTFCTADRSQLGVLTSEVEPIFSTMVHDAEFNHCGIDKIKTVDRTQIRYAHLAATQALIQRVSTLKGIVLTT